MKEEPQFDDAAEAPLPRGASDPVAAAAAPAAAITVEEKIELAKQRAREIVSRIFITAVAPLQTLASMKEEPQFDDAAEAPLPRGASDPLAAAAAPAAAIPVDEKIELAKQRAHEIVSRIFITAVAPLQTLASTAEESQYPKRKLDDAADAPLPRGATTSDPLSAAAAPEIELAKQRAREIVSQIFIAAVAPLQTLASTAEESQYPKRKFHPPLPHGATTSDPLSASAAPEIELAKQRAREIVSRIFIAAVAPFQTLASTVEESQYPKRKFDDAADALLPRGATASDPLSAAAAPEIELAKQRAHEIVSRIFIMAEAKRPRVENGAGGAEETKGFGSAVPAADGFQTF